MMDTLRVAVRRFEPFERAIQRQFDAYVVATGSRLRLDVASLDLNPLVDTLFTRGGLKDGTWDVAFIVTDWLAEAIDEGALLDLSPYLAEEPIPGYPEGWAPTLTRPQRDGDAIYGIPYHDGPECLIYRADLFHDPVEQAAFTERHGRPLTVPRTWAEFEEVARHFTRPDEGRYGTVFAAFPDGHNSVYDFCLQLWSRGGELTDGAGAVRLDTVEAAEALDFLRRMIADRRVTPPELQEIDSVASGALFAGGSIAMMVNWFGFAAVCEQSGCPVKGKVGVAPVPAGAEAPRASLVVTWSLAVAAGSRHPREAYRFIRTCATAEGDKITTLEGGIGCRRSTWEDADVNAQVPYYRQLDELHEVARELPRCRSLPALIQVIDAAVQAAIATTEPIADILSRAQATAASIRL